MSKISKRQYEELVEDMEYFKKELAELEETFKKIKEVVDNCQECDGTGQVENGTGSPSHNPYGAMLYRKCRRCEGKGYIK